MSLMGIPEQDYPRLLKLTQELFGSSDPELARDTDGNGGWRFAPYVSGYKVVVDPVALKREFTIDPEKKISVTLFVETAPYKLFGLIPMHHRLFEIAGPFRRGWPRCWEYLA